ncbi:hypothetical protein ZWY2020_006422 [Hordeum vulgare]|nr:hypothetical protein ZWY2020_006422 [Hordeum vulgare]
MDDDKKQNGGKKAELNTSFEIPDDIYADYCTPDEKVYVKETTLKRQIRLQKIEQRWAKEGKEYKYVKPKYFKKFSVKPPCNRLLWEINKVLTPQAWSLLNTILRKQQSMWQKRKVSKQGVTSFNEESATAAAIASSCAAKASTTEPTPKKALMKKSGVEPKSSTTLSKQQNPQPAPRVAAMSSAATKYSFPLQPQSSQHPTGTPIPSRTSASGFAHNSSTGILKKTTTAGRGTRPSPNRVVLNYPSASEDEDEYDDETLEAIIRNKQERVAQARGSTIPLALEPKVVLYFINISYKDPNTPTDDLKLPPGPSHMVATFINEEKWKAQQAK